MGACRWCYTFPLHVNTEAYSNVLLNRLVWTPTSRQELVELVSGSHVPAPPRRDGARQRSFRSAAGNSSALRRWFTSSTPPNLIKSNQMKLAKEPRLSRERGETQEGPRDSTLHRGMKERHRAS